MLGQLIADYERTQPKVQTLLAEVSDTTAAEALAFLMQENGLTQSALARETGLDQGHLSAFLSGKRGLSKAAAMTLARRFSVSAETFLVSEQPEQTREATAWQIVSEGVSKKPYKPRKNKTRSENSVE